MHKMKKLIIFFLIILTFISCDDKNKGFEFEKVDPDPEYKVFEMLDDYPALKSSIKDLDQHWVNVLMADAINNNIEESKKFLTLFPKTVEPTVTMLRYSKDILGRIIQQDILDKEEGNTLYADNFYLYLDGLFKENLNLTSEMIAMTNKFIKYFYENHSDSLEDKMGLVIDFLKDNEGQNIGTILPLLEKGLVKILLIDNENMVYNGIDTGLGNSVRGTDALFSGFTDIFVQDEEAKKAFIDLLNSSTSILVADINGKKSSEVLKEFMINVEKYATASGDIFKINKDYNNDSGGIYVNTNMINGVRELWPSLVSLFIRSKGDWKANQIPDFSVIYNKEGESVLEFLTHQFHQLKLTAGIDLSDETSPYGNGGIEESLLRMVEYNAYGVKRDVAEYKVSYLDHLLYTLTAAYDFGYLTRLSSIGEPFNNHKGDGDSTGFGHGKSTKGIMTLNDTLYSMTTGTKVDDLGKKHSAYSLALTQRVTQAEYISRSSEPFSKNEMNQHKFYMGYDFPALALLNGFSAGDAGIPNGGNRVDEIEQDQGRIQNISQIDNATLGEDYKTYFSKVGNGLGDLNTSRWVMGWIARSCWEGEGPYYSTKAPAGKESSTTLNIDGSNKTVSVYYLPSGKIYAYVYKANEGDRNSWRYFYPVNGNDKEDKSDDVESWGGRYQRTNRYQPIWHTDYFLFKTEYSNNDHEKKYYAIDSVVGTEGEDKYLMAKFRDKELIKDKATNKAGALWYHEKIKESDESRECDSQEEAMIRNFQWLMFEKKMVFTIPMRSYVGVANIDVDSVIMSIIEANGIQGVANAKKGSQNGYWNIKGNEGIDLGTPQKVTNINYGDSYELGDSRVVVIIKEDGDYTLFGAAGDSVDLDTIFNKILGNYNVLPNVVGSNLTPITKMAFIEPIDIPSDSDIIGDTTNDIWKNRNKLFPIIAALISNLHESSYYDTYESGYSYNFNGKHKYPLKVIRDLIFMLGQPLVRHFDTEGGRWVPRMNDEGNHQGDESTAYFAPDDYNNYGVDYRPKENLRSVTNILTESEVGKVDGFIPLLAKTKLITKALNFLQVTGKEDAPYADTDKTSDDYKQWGARRKIFYGLEQILTSIKTTEGIASKRGYFDLIHHGFFFEKTDKDLDLDIILEQTVGSANLNLGMAAFVKNRPNPKDWKNFDFAIDSLGALLATNGEYGAKYSILVNFINVLTKFLENSTVTDDQLISLRHTFGTILASYSKKQNKWRYHTELDDILTKELPKILDVFRGNYISVLKVILAFTKKDGLVDYFITNLSTESSSKEIMRELYNFLNSDLIALSTSKFWTDMTDLFAAMANMLGEKGQIEL